MLQIDTANEILLDGQRVGLSLTQRQDRTVVYTPESRAGGRAYREHDMPHQRYSTAHAAPASGAAGSVQLEADLRDLLARLERS